MGMFGYSDMAPPSYAAAVGEQPTNIAGDDDAHTQGNLSYLPVYTFAQPYQVTFLIIYLYTVLWKVYIVSQKFFSKNKICTQILVLKLF